MDIKLLSKVPKKYHIAIKDAYHDDDGYWVIIGCDSGWKLEGYLAEYTVHEDTWREVLVVVKQCLIRIN